MKNITAELNFRVGKRKFFKIDIIDLISTALNISKSEAKRLILQRAVGMWIDVKEKERAGMAKSVNAVVLKTTG